MLSEAVCLAMVMYLEGRGEGTQGMKEIGKTTIARSLDRRWPDSICHVVTQAKDIKVNKTKHVDDYGTVYYTYDKQKVCQFESFCKDGDLLSSLRDPAKVDSKAWEESNRLTEKMLSNRYKYKDSPKWFVANYIEQPGWTNNLCVDKKHLKHIFYNDCK